MVIHYSKYSKSVQIVVIHYLFSSESLRVVNSLQIVNSLPRTAFSMSGSLGKGISSQIDENCRQLWTIEDKHRRTQNITYVYIFI